MIGYRKFALAGAGVLAVALSTGVAQAAPLASQDSAIHRDKAEFARATRDNARATVNAFLLSKGKDKATADSLIETARFTDSNGRTQIRYEQRLNGLRVYGGYAKAAFDKNGALTHLIERTGAAGGFKARPTITDAEALAVAIDANFKGATVPALTSRKDAVADFARTAFFHKGPSVERVVIADAVNSEGFLVETWSQKDNKLYHTLVDGVGRVVHNELRTADDSYNVFAIHPGATPQAVLNGPGAGNAQSPAGWLNAGVTTRNIFGNNVYAALDLDANNTPDAGGVAVTNGAFLTAANLAQDPSTAANRDVAVQNLFYLTNVAHDRLYSLGFIESQGNFQESNFGNGGVGSDSVNADGQDGAGTNNANFATPADGSNPRMQMFIFTRSTPSRDGDVDADVLFHEYGHGVSWRMIGGMSGDIAGALGEGMSDALGILMTNNDIMGEYSWNDAVKGIRSSRYSTHPDTLSSYNRSRGVHRNGEIYAATIWDVYEQYQAGGLTADNLIGDMLGGTNFTPVTPTYIDMRDGILQHVSGNSTRTCMVWRGFAARGMGVGATMNRRNGKVSQSFTVPSGC